MISSAIAAGTSSYLANCIVDVARPCVIERRSVTYPNICPSGTWARITCEPLRASIERMRPRRLFRSPTTAPMYSSGVTTSTSITGSRRTGLALRHARSEEHTSELQSHSDLVCRLLLEKKKPKITKHDHHSEHEQSVT